MFECDLTAVVDQHELEAYVKLIKDEMEQNPLQFDKISIEFALKFLTCLIQALCDKNPRAKKLDFGQSEQMSQLMNLMGITSFMTRLKYVSQPKNAHVWILSVPFELIASETLENAASVVLTARAQLQSKLDTKEVEMKEVLEEPQINENKQMKEMKRVGSREIENEREDPAVSKFLEEVTDSDVKSCRAESLILSQLSQCVFSFLFCFFFVFLESVFHLVVVFHFVCKFGVECS